VRELNLELLPGTKLSSDELCGILNPLVKEPESKVVNKEEYALGS
jgi:hypothetical protein